MNRVVLFISAMTLAALPTGAATNLFSVAAVNSQNYIINGVNDPPLTLVRGFTYQFDISVAANHPFYIKTIAGIGTGNRYDTGVTGQGTTSGTITFSVPGNAPDTLFYQCSNHSGMTGPLNLVDAPSVDITSFVVGTNIELKSTGTDNLNLSVQTRSSLTNATWSLASIQSNVYADGTNTTEIALPAGKSAFFQIQQGFF